MRGKRTSPNRLILGLFVALWLLSAPALSGQVIDNWVSNSSKVWSTPGNWSTGTPTATSDATFNTAAGQQNFLLLSPATATHSLVFSSSGGANAYTFDSAGNANANTLTLGAGGITNTDPGIITFYNATTLGANQSWTNNGGTMVVTGKVNLGSGSNGYALNVAGSGAVNLGGVIGNGGTAAGSLVYSGTGTLTLTGANTYTGTTSVNSGTLNIQNAGALGTAANTATTTVANGAVVQIQGNIVTTNGGTLVLNGNGNGNGAFQNISANNTWSGGVKLGSDATISNATAGNILYLGAFTATSFVALGSNTLTVNGAGDTFINANLGAVGDTGGLVKNGTGTLTLWGYNSFYTGATVVNAGSLELVVGPMTAGRSGINGPLTVGTGSVTNTATVDIWSSSHTYYPSAAGMSYPNQLSASTAVTMNAGGTLNVGSSTTAGSFTMNGGAVNITGGQTVTLSGGVTASANAAHATSQILGGTLALVSPNTTIDVARDTSLTSDLNISSVISGAAVTKTGGGIVTLTGTNTYNGGTTLSAGTILANNNSALGTGTVTIAGGNLGSTTSSTLANAISLQGNATLSGLTNSGVMTQSGGSYTLNLSNFTQSGGLVLSSGAGAQTLTAQVATGTSTFSGVISDAGSGSGLTKTGAGTLVLGAANTYSGATTVNGGTLQLTANNAISASSAVSLNNATLDLNGRSVTVGNLSFSNAIINFGTGTPTNTFVFGNLTSASGILTINGWTSGSTTLAATTSGIASSLLGQLYFTGTGSGAVESSTFGATGNGQANGYIITPNNTFLNWTGAVAATSPKWGTTVTGTTNWSSGVPSTAAGSLQKLNFTGTGAGNYLAPALDNSYSANALKFDSTAGAFTLAEGGNTLTMNGAVPSIIQQSAANQTISGGAIALAANSVVDVSGTGSLTIGSALTGSGNLTKLSAGTLALSGNNSGYSGAISVNSGILRVSGSNSVLGTGATSVQSGGTLQVNSALTLGGPLSLIGTGQGGVGALYATPGAGNTATMTGPITLGNNATINTGSGTLVLGGGITGSGYGLTIGGAGNTTVTGAIATGNGTLTVGGTGTTTLSAANTYTGTTTVNSGTLNLTNTSLAGGLTIAGGAVNDNASNQLSSSSALTVNGGSFNLLNQSETVASLSGASAGTIALGNGTLTVAGTSKTTFAGSLTGSGTLANTNTGSLTLSKASTGFTGTVNLSNGVIAASATNATGSATVNVSGTGNFQVLGGSTLASNFNLTTNGAATRNGAIENISGANTLSGSVAVTANSRIQSDSGTLTLSGPVNVSSGTTLNLGGPGNLTLNGAITGSGTSLLTKDGSGTLALGAANTGFTGAANVNVGTLQGNVANTLSNASSITVNASGTLLSNANDSLSTAAAMLVNSGGTLSLNGTSATFSGLLNNAGALAMGTGGTLTLSGSSATLSGTITGTGTLILTAGEVLTLGANFNDTGLNIVLNGGTLKVNGTNAIFGNLTVSATSVIDFAQPSASVLQVSGLTMASGQTLNVNNWAALTDYFYASVNPGATALSQVQINNSPNPAAWNSYTDGPYNDHQIVPTPEPATYGAVLLLGTGLLLGWRRRHRN